MNGTSSPLQISFSVDAVSSAMWRDSTTPGPAIRNKGLSSPASNPQSFMLSSRDRGLGLAGLVLQSGLDERREERMPAAGRRGEFRMELAADEPRVRWQLDHLAQLLALGEAGGAQALVLQSLHVLVVHLVAMAVAFVDHVSAVDLAREAPGLERGALSSQPHRAAEIGLFVAALDAAVVVLPLGHERDHRVRRVAVEFRAVRAREADDVSRKLDHRELHAQANAQIQDLVLARVLDRLHHAFHAALAETARNEYRVHAFQERANAVLLDRLRIHITDVDSAARVDPGVDERLVQGLVGIGKVDILADHGDGDLVLGMLERLDQLLPYLELGRLGDDAELVADDFIQHLLVQHPGNPVDRVRVPDGDDGVRLNVGEQRDFFLFVLEDGPVGAAQERIGLDADPAQLLHRVLRGLGLDLARALDERHERQVDVAGVVWAKLQAHLPHRLEKGKRLDVPNSAADLDDRHFRFACAARNERLDLVGDMRDHLHRAAEVVAAALFSYHRIVDLAGGEVVVAVHPGRLETLVMAQIEVGLGAVLGNEHLPVLEGAHRAAIDVDVRVELEESDFDAARFEDRGEGGGGYPLPQRGNHTARHEHILGHLKPGGWDGEWYMKTPPRSIRSRLDVLLFAGGALRLAELRSVPEMRERLGIRERLDVLHRLPVHHVAHGELDDLVRLGARNIGHLHDFRGDVPRSGMGANLVLDLRDQPVFEDKPLAELHEQDHAHIADLAGRPGLADHERFDHLLQLLDLAVDLRRADAHAPRVEHGIRSAVNDHAFASGDLAPIAVGPDSGKSLEVGGPVFRSAGVVPESDRQRWKWPRADKFALLLFHRAGVFVEHLDPEAEGSALDFAAPHRQDRVSEHEASADVGSARDR